MSRVSAEAVAVALFARLQTVPGLVTCSRELKDFDQVPPAEQPAGFQASEPVNAAPPAPSGGGRSTAGVTQWTRHYTWFFYVHRASLPVDTLLDTMMNTIEDAVRAALAPSAGQTSQTLGGLVADCRIVGTIERHGGVLIDQGVLIVPIEVRCFPSTS